MNRVSFLKEKRCAEQTATISVISIRFQTGASHVQICEAGERELPAASHGAGQPRVREAILRARQNEKLKAETVSNYSHY